MTQSENGSHIWFTSKFLVIGGAYFTSQGYELGASVSLPDDNIDFDSESGVEDCKTLFAEGSAGNLVKSGLLPLTSPKVLVPRLHGLDICQNAPCTAPSRSHA
jgi:hypothetical protein